MVIIIVLLVVLTGFCAVVASASFRLYRKDTIPDPAFKTIGVVAAALAVLFFLVSASAGFWGW